MELGERFAQGGEEELWEVVEAFGQRLLRYCQGILCDSDEAQDAVQLTFIKAYQKRKGLRGKALLAPWLYRIAYTTCVDLLRRRAARQKLAERCPPGLVPLWADTADGMSPALAEALGTLSPAERALLFARAVEDLTYEALSKAFHVPQPTLRKRYERAKKKLAERLEASGTYRFPASGGIVRLIEGDGCGGVDGTIIIHTEEEWEEEAT